MRVPAGNDVVASRCCFALRWCVAATELLTLHQSLNFTSPKQLFQYLYTDVIRGNTAARTTLAVDVNGVTTRV